MRKELKAGRWVAGIWLWDPGAFHPGREGAQGPREWAAHAEDGRLLALWTQHVREGGIELLVDEEPRAALQKRARLITENCVLRIPTGDLRYGRVPYSSKGPHLEDPGGEPVDHIPPGNYSVTVFDASWREGVDGARFERALVARVGRGRFRACEFIENGGWIVVGITLILMPIAAYTAWKDRAMDRLPGALLTLSAIAGAAWLARFLLLRMPGFREVTWASEEMKRDPAWQTPDILIVLRRLRNDADLSSMRGVAPGAWEQSEEE